MQFVQALVVDVPQVLSTAPLQDSLTLGPDTHIVVSAYLQQNHSPRVKLNHQVDMRALFKRENVECLAVDANKHTHTLARGCAFACRHTFVHLPIYLSICLSVCPSVRLSVCLSVRLAPVDHTHVCDACSCEYICPGMLSDCFQSTVSI